jgi:hypothetical protein
MTERQGVVVYQQVVPEMTHEPDYPSAIGAARNMLD